MNKKLFSSSFITVIMLIVLVLILKKNNINLNIVILTFLIFESVAVVISIIFKKTDLIIITSVIIVITFFFGVRIKILNDKENKVIRSINNSIMGIGYINEFPYHKKKALYFPVKIIAIKSKERSDYFKVQPYKILVRIADAKKKYSKGDLVVIKKKISFPQKKIGNFNYRNYLLYHTIYGLVYTKESSVKIINHKIQRNLIVRIFQKSIWKFRRNLLSKLKNNLLKNSYSFILSIFFGIRNELDPNIYKEFQDTGMTHLLAISGLHIGFIGMLFFNFFHLFLSKSKSYLLAIVSLSCYILVIVPSGSSLRAFLMFVFFGLFFILGMKSIGITLLSLSGIILIFINPYFIFDLGFQFSFLATFSILIFSKKIENILPKIIPNKIKSLFSVTIAAFISLFFLQWALFSKLALFSIVSSPFIVFLFGILFSVLFFAVILYYLTNIIIITKIIDFLIIIFLKLISLLNIIPPIKLPKIPIEYGYIFLTVFYIFFVLLIPFFKKKLLINKKTSIVIDIK